MSWTPRQRARGSGARQLRFRQFGGQRGRRYDRRAGEGARELLLLHGWLMCGDVFDPLVAELSGRGAFEDFRFTAIDLPGSGPADAQEDVGADAWNESALAVAIGELIDELELGPVTLLGHSMGGQLALLLAAQRPELFDQLVLVTPVPTTGLELPPDVAALFASAADDMSARRTIVDTVCLELSEPSRSHLYRCASHPTPGAVAASLTAWPVGVPSVDVSRIRTRTDIIGTDDGFLPPALLHNQIVAKLSEAAGAQLHHLAGIGHYPQVEATSALADLLESVLAGPHGSS